VIGEMDIQFSNQLEEMSKEKDYFQTVIKGMMEGVLVVDEHRSKTERDEEYVRRMKIWVNFLWMFEERVAG